jgi:hypothetical protein
VRAFLLIVGGVVVMFVAVEIVLVKVSRHRLTHGDGKEHAFRSGRGRTS